MAEDSKIKKKILLSNEHAPSPDLSALSEVKNTLPWMPAHVTGLRDLFDQFYRPIAMSGDLGMLLQSEVKHDLKPEIATGTLHSVLLSNRDGFPLVGEKLADDIYEAAQITRKDQIDSYLEIFQKHLGEYSWPERYEIVKIANEVFSRKFDRPIKERGERPEILAQIAKRVASEHRSRLNEIAEGFNIAEIANDIYLSLHSFDPLNPPEQHPRSRIREVLKGHSLSQAHALRARLAAIPYEKIATELDGILNEIERQANKPGQDFFDWLQKEESHRTEVAPAAPLAQLEYIFSGRTKAQIALIENCYNDLFVPTSLARGGGIPSWLRHRADTLLGPTRATTFRLILEGFNPEHEAHRLHALIFPGAAEAAATKKTIEVANNPTKESEILDPLSDPHEFTVNPDHINPKLIGKFLKRASLRYSSSIEDRIALQEDLIQEKLALFAAEQRRAISDQLNQLYGYHLPVRLLAEARQYSIRELAGRLIEVFSRLHKPRELLSLLSGLTPAEVGALRVCFQSLTGSSLEIAIREDLNQQFNGSPPEEWAKLFENRLSGVSRDPLHLDLFSIAQLPDVSSSDSPWLSNLVFSDEFEDAAIKVAQLLLDKGSSAADKYKDTLNLFSALALRQRQGIERAFYQISSPEVSFRSFIKEHLLIEECSVLEGLLLGLDDWLLKVDFQPKIDDFLQLRVAPLNVLKVCLEQIINRSQNVAGSVSDSQLVDLCNHLVSQYGSSPALIDALSVILTPLAESVFKSVLSLARRDLEEIQELKRKLSLPMPIIGGLERAYDSRFGRLRIHLKLIASQDYLSEADFAQLILSLEALPTNLLNDIRQQIDSLQSEQLWQILEQYQSDQVTLEECYNIFFSGDALRKTILSLPLPEDDTHELVLHLDSYYPRRVAKKIASLMTKHEGERLGQLINRILTPGTIDNPNYLIPSDPNWVEEMTHQVRLAFRKSSGCLITSLRNGNVPEELVWQIFVRLYGQNISEIVASIGQLVSAAAQLSDSPVFLDSDELPSIEAVVESLSMRGERFKQQVLEGFGAFFGCYFQDRSLLELLSTYRDQGHLFQRLRIVLR